ncbi:MAG TPA: hypothetical protein VGJ60_31300 [Chloroflexota bacterium]|jgi:hypothetical protein
MIYRSKNAWLVAAFALFVLGVMVWNARQPENQANAYVNQNVRLPRSLFTEAEVLDMRTLHPLARRPLVIDSGVSVHEFTDSPTLTAGDITYVKVRVLTGAYRGRTGYMATDVVTPMT